MEAEVFLQSNFRSDILLHLLHSIYRKQVPKCSGHYIGAWIPGSRGRGGLSQHLLTTLYYSVVTNDPKYHWECLWHFSMSSLWLSLAELPLSETLTIFWQKKKRYQKYFMSLPLNIWLEEGYVARDWPQWYREDYLRKRQ